MHHDGNEWCVSERVAGKWDDAERLAAKIYNHEWTTSSPVAGMAKNSNLTR